MDTNESLIQIGLRARDMRRRRDMTLDELSAAAALSKGHLSRFERGEKSLSMAAMLRLTEALRMSVAALLGEDQGADDIHVVRRAERTRLVAEAEDGGLVMQSLNGSMPGRPDYAAFVVTCPEGIAHSPEAFHSGCEAIFVLRGTLTVRLEQSREIALDTGDFLEFPGHRRHVLSGGPGGTEILLFVLGN
ncbi:helix-turn-helix transcriptional regulator [Oceanicella sp. SM1341]|uniref:helix-turn-helix transcriptional regulator n=1 Tax=Oceanicella sp. SM1341 TaxID=1548889 RepID=UPI0018E5671E|nr:helix-turn-helix transcriptional regulator [Oceanicella sp. SM1341]